MWTGDPQMDKMPVRRLLLRSACEDLVVPPVVHQFLKSGPAREQIRYVLMVVVERAVNHDVVEAPVA